MATNRASVWVYAVSGIVVVAGGAALLWRARGKEKTSEEIASVAGKALDDRKLQRQAEAVAKSVVGHVLKDASTLAAVQTLVYNFLHLPETDAALAALVDRVLRRDDVVVWVQALVRGQVALLDCITMSFAVQVPTRRSPPAPRPPRAVATCGHPRLLPSIFH